MHSSTFVILGVYFVIAFMIALAVVIRRAHPRCSACINASSILVAARNAMLVVILTLAMIGAIQCFIIGSRVIYAATAIVFSGNINILQQ